MESISRRSFIVGMAGFAAFGVAGCTARGTGTSLGSAMMPSEPVSSSSESREAETNESQSRGGAVQVPEAAARTITLNSGYEMPAFGLGTWTLGSDIAESSTYAALVCGYRLVDTAEYYGNENGVGRAIARAAADGVVAREDVFVTSKIAPSGERDYDAAVDARLDRLGLDYLDLLLVHQQGAGDEALYQALERAVDAGKVRSIGISNFYTTADFDRIADSARVKPAVVQNENHIRCQGAELRAHAAGIGAFVESYYPLGGRAHVREHLTDETIVRIAQEHGATPAQVILGWHLQAGYIAIPGSSDPVHIQENAGALGIELSDADMQAIAALDTGRRYENW